VKRDDIDVQVQNHALFLRAEMRQEQTQEPQGQQAGAQGQGQQATGQGHQGGAQGQGRQWHTRERRYGFFERIIPLPDNVDEENVSCEFRDGVLTIHIPKMAPAGTRGRRIPIGEGSSQQLSGQQGGARAAIGAGSTSGANPAPAGTGAGNGRTISRQPAASGTKGGQTGTGGKRGGKNG
jgi:HSP20 family molecular chaperone IbpA